MFFECVFPGRERQVASLPAGTGRRNRVGVEPKLRGDLKVIRSRVPWPSSMGSMRPSRMSLSVPPSIGSKNEYEILK